jgi:hypothetical protein
MTVHRPHPVTDPDRAASLGLSRPDDPSSVLYDECDRCREHAGTLTSLDESHLRGLWLRGSRGRTLTAAEHAAYGRLQTMVLAVEMATRIPVRTLIEAGVDLIPLTKENR